MSPGLELAAAVVVVVALSLLGSVFLSADRERHRRVHGVRRRARGRAARADRGGASPPLGHARRVARIASFALPFEALYQDALSRLTVDTSGFTRYAVRLGPFGGASVGGPTLTPWVIGYLLVVGAIAIARRSAAPTL